MEQLNNLDVIFLIITGVSALVGIARGMTKELLSITGWVLAAAAIFYLVPLVDPITQKYVASKILASVVSGLFILVVFSIVWILTVDKISSVIRSSKLSALDRILGFAFGMVRGIIIVILIALMITTLIPEESKKGVFAESKYFAEAASCAKPLASLVPDSLIEKFKSAGESLGFAADEDKKDDDNTTNNSATEDNNGDNKADSNASQSDDDSASADGQESKSLFENPFEAMDSNLEMLQKSGEELFNKLAQPKASGEGGEDSSPIENMGSDLDRLLDVLEDRVVLTDDETPELKSDTQKITEKIIEKLEGN